jgi:hypothetical protein
VLARARHEPTADRGLALRACDVVDLRPDRLTRAGVAARRDAGEHPLKHHVGEPVARREVRVGRQLDLVPAIGGASARALDRHAPATEGDLAAIVAVTHCGAARIVLALRAHDLVELKSRSTAGPGRIGSRRAAVASGCGRAQGGTGSNH